MILTIAGITYLEETYSLIFNEITARKLENHFTIEKIKLYNGSGEYPAAIFRQDKPGANVNEKSSVQHCHRILILTDRDCSGMTIRPDECMNRINLLCSRISPEDYVIVNVDDMDLIRHLEGMECRVVTFGFNSKACITASSLAEDINGSGYLCSLQSSIKAASGEIVEPGEVKILDVMESKPYPVMAYCGFLLVAGLKKPGD